MGTALQTNDVRRVPRLLERFRATPVGVRAALAGLAVLMVLLSGWNSSQRYLTYYAVAARSMSSSWRAFFFGSFDPAATVTLDKLAGFAVPQALLARLVGFHRWSVGLPQVIEGLVTLLAVYVIGSRWRGRATGLLAAAAVVTTPLLPGMFGRDSEDGLLTMSLTLAFLATQSALRGRPRALWWAAFWVAVGFQAKMMQAWFVLPALCGAVLLAAGTWPRRLRRALLLAAASVLLSLTWVTAIQLVPAADRPYIDGSTSNNAFAMVFGYNGFNRLIPNLIPGAVGDHKTDTQRPASEPEVPAVPAMTSPAKLVAPVFLTQIGWWYPPALLGAGFLLGPLIRRRRAGPPDPTGVALTGWLLIDAVFLTLTPIPHTAYLSAIGIQVALLAGYGVTEAVARLGTASGPRRWVLPGLLAAQLLWVVAIAAGHLSVWVPLAVTALGGAAVAALARGQVRFRPAAVGLGAVAVLLAPAVFLFFLTTRSDVAHADPYAGPLPGLPLPGDHDFSLTVPFHSQPDERLGHPQRAVADYVRAHPGPDGPALATDYWLSGQPYMLDDDLEVQVFGGYSGSVAHPTLAQFRTEVAAGRIRFVLLNTVVKTISPTVVQIAGGNNEGAPVIALRRWVTANCPALDPAVYESGTYRLSGQTLYDCAPAG